MDGTRERGMKMDDGWLGNDMEKGTKTAGSGVDLKKRDTEDNGCVKMEN